MPDEIPSVPRKRGKRNRPVDSRWRQQQLPAFRPLLTAKCALWITLLSGLLFIGVGVLIYLAAQTVKEEIIDYTDCSLAAGSLTRRHLSPAAPCIYRLQLLRDFKGDVLFQYGLERFYQNARHYIRSRNDRQLSGELDEVHDCDPYDYVTDGGGIRRKIVPCGSIANSMFNDSFALTYHTREGQSVPVPFSYKNVIWDGERRVKFKNPTPATNQTLVDMLKGYAKPIAWNREIWQLGDGEAGNMALENIDLIVWMKPAALPKFRKNYRSLSRTGLFQDGLPSGNYTLKIAYNYPVDEFNGKKRFIISTVGWVRSKNPFLGISFLTFGVFLLLVTALLCCAHLKQRVQDHF